jgi:hypothetical protein
MWDVVRDAWAGVRKPPKEETADRKGRVLVGRDLWGFEDRVRVGRVGAVAGGAQSSLVPVHKRQAFDIIS